MPEGADLSTFGKNHTTEGTTGANAPVVVYVHPLGLLGRAPYSSKRSGISRADTKEKQLATSIAVGIVVMAKAVVIVGTPALAERMAPRRTRVPGERCRIGFTWILQAPKHSSLNP